MRYALKKYGDQLRIRVRFQEVFPLYFGLRTDHPEIRRNFAPRSQNARKDIQF